MVVGAQLAGLVPLAAEAAGGVASFLQSLLVILKDRRRVLPSLFHARRLEPPLPSQDSSRNSRSF